MKMHCTLKMTVHGNFAHGITNVSQLSTHRQVAKLSSPTVFSMANHYYYINLTCKKICPYNIIDQYSAYINYQHWQAMTHEVQQH